MTERGKKFRKEVIKVARDIFRKYGYTRTTMEDIAKALNKGKSTLYYYFRSKEDIFAALIEEEGNKIQNGLLQVINRKGDTRTLLRSYILKRMDYSNKVARYYDDVKDEYLNVYHVIDKYRKRFDEFEIMALKNILLRGIQSGEVRISIDELDAVAYGLASAIKGLEIPFFIESKYAYFKERINILLEILFCGILKDCPYKEES